MTKSVDYYYPNMDKIKSNIKFDIDKIYNNINKDIDKKDILISLSKDNLDYQDYYNLLSDNALEYLDNLAIKAQENRIRYFGNNVSLFSPIYISNYCENSCRYCGFRSKNEIERAKLNLEEVEVEMYELSKTGIEDVLILTGESKVYTDIEYLKEACLIAKKYFKVIGLEVNPLNIKDYEILKKAGADFITVFQETYNKEAYSYYHPTGFKRSFNYRLDTQERVLMAGLRGVGFGALFGLDDPLEDAFKLAVHADLIQKKYPEAEITISLPRIRPTKGEDKDIEYNLVSEKKLFQIMLAIRIFMPYANITLSTRESKEFRNLAVKYAATKISASVDTSIGHRSKKSSHSGDNQFVINDERTTDEVIKDLEDINMTPVFSDYIYL